MGVPDLMRYVARDAPNALRKFPRVSGAVQFDYILVDMSNSLQTLQTVDLNRLLLSDTRATKALILILDGQRQRQGSVREQRQFLQQREGDITVQQLAVSLLSKERDGNATSAGRVVVVGREVAGEGDYKLLSLHRRIQAAHHARRNASGLTKPPTFLFVSEDSDVLCGALLGPEPDHISIATTLHAAMHELHLLDVGAVAQRVFGTSGFVAFLERSPRGFAQTSTAATQAAQTAGPRKTFGDDDADHPAQPMPVRRAKTTPQQVAVHSAAMDFVFLFSLILGTSTTPSITRGATRVDIAACWSHYAALMRGRRKLISGGYAEGPLLRVAPDDTSADTVVLDAELLATLLEARFADDVSHIPTPDERKYAREYVKHVVKSVVDLVTGAPNDTRPDAGKFTKPPSLACFNSVLGLHDERAYEIKFDFALRPVVINQRDKEDDAQPIRRVASFFDRESVRLGTPTHSTAPLFWPPHEARPISGSSGVHKAEVALPLGAQPVTLAVPLATLVSNYCASLSDSLHAGIKDTVVSASMGDDTAASSTKPREQQDMVFDFDMRRMVPSTAAFTSLSAEETAAKKLEAKNRILAAAGLSVSYFDGTKAVKSTAAAPAADLQDMPSDKRNKLVARAAKAAKLAALGVTPANTAGKKEPAPASAAKAKATPSVVTSGDSALDSADTKPKKRLGKRERAKKAIFAKRDKARASASS